jgi:hypothetical protein
MHILPKKPVEDHLPNVPCIQLVLDNQVNHFEPSLKETCGTLGARVFLKRVRIKNLPKRLYSY